MQTKLVSDSLELYKSILSNYVESYSQTNLVSMIRLLRNINPPYQAYFLDILSMENENYEHIIHIMEENCRHQEKYYESLIKSSKFLDSLKAYHDSKLQISDNTYVNQLTNLSGFHITEIIQEYNKNKLIVCGLKGSINKHSPILVVGFKGNIDSKVSKWARIVTSKVNEFFQPIIHERLDSFVIFYKNIQTIDHNELTVTYPTDLNVIDCKIEYVVPQINNPLYHKILDRSKDLLFLNYNDLINSVRKTINNIYKIMREIEQWMLNYPSGTKPTDENTLVGLIHINKRNKIYSMQITMQIDISTALAGLTKSVKSVIVEPYRDMYIQNTLHICTSLQNAIMNRLSTGQPIVEVVSQAIEYCKLT